MDIHEMIEKGIPIYVINRSATVLGTPHRLMLNFPNPNGGRPNMVSLPPVQYPVNLSQMVAPPSAIGACQEFLNLLNRGVLELVPADRARQILANPDVQEVVKHAFKKMDKRANRPGGVQAKKPNFKVVNSGSRATQSDPYPDEPVVSATAFLRDRPGVDNPFQDKLLEMDSVPASEVLASTATINAKVMQLCADLQSNPELKQDYLLEIKAIDPDSLSQEDLGYLIDNLRGFDNIVAYVRGIMAKRVGNPGTRAGKAQRNPAKKPTKESTSAVDAMESALDD
jgi:hypothetical protein